MAAKIAQQGLVLNPAQIDALAQVMFDQFSLICEQMPNWSDANESPETTAAANLEVVKAWVRSVYPTPLGRIQSALEYRYGAMFGYAPGDTEGTLGDPVNIGDTLFNLLLTGIVGESARRVEARMPELDLAWARDYERDFFGGVELLANNTDSLPAADLEFFAEGGVAPNSGVAIAGPGNPFSLGTPRVAGQYDLRAKFNGCGVRR